MIGFDPTGPMTQLLSPEVRGWVDTLGDLVADKVERPHVWHPNNQNYRFHH